MICAKQRVPVKSLNASSLDRLTCERGIERKNLYLKNGTLDTSWSNIEPSVIEIVDGAKGKEWRLRFDNPNAPDSSKRSLYMFFSLPGNFIAANYSGK